MNQAIFNVRVYGICYNAQNQILVSDEIRFGKKMTKFPGGGLEFGEGTIDCLIREFREEINEQIINIEHFYTTDFFQPSAFNSKQQVISIYYKAALKNPEVVETKQKRFDFDEEKEAAQIFRWMSLEDFNPEELTFPIDRHVGKMLINE